MGQQNGGHKEDRSKKFKILERDKNVTNDSWNIDAMWKFCFMSNTCKKVWPKNEGSWGLPPKELTTTTNVFLFEIFIHNESCYHP